MKLGELQETIKITRLNSERKRGSEESLGDSSPADDIIKKSEFKADRADPNNQQFDDEGNEIGPTSGEQEEKKVIKSQYGTRPGAPTDGMGGSSLETGISS